MISQVINCIKKNCDFLDEIFNSSSFQLLTSFIQCNSNELTRLFPELIVIICNINESQRTFWVAGIWENLKKGTSSSCTRASFEILGKESEKVFFYRTLNIFSIF